MNLYLGHKTLNNDFIACSPTSTGKTLCGHSDAMYSSHTCLKYAGKYWYLLGRVHSLLEWNLDNMPP